MMSQYLPFLREVMPSAAEEIESDIHDYIFKQASSDGFVYDFYAVKNDVETMAESTANHFFLWFKWMTMMTSMMVLMIQIMELMILMMKTTPVMIIQMKSHLEMRMK
nr:RNA-directed DNA methylation 4 isoform X1 [Ipomoea batatas]